MLMTGYPTVKNPTAVVNPSNAAFVNHLPTLEGNCTTEGQQYLIGVPSNQNEAHNSVVHHQTMDAGFGHISSHSPFRANNQMSHQIVTINNVLTSDVNKVLGNAMTPAENKDQPSLSPSQDVSGHRTSNLQSMLDITCQSFQALEDAAILSDICIPNTSKDAGRAGCGSPKPFVDDGCQSGVKAEWEVDVQAGVKGFDITQTGEIICCTWGDVRMLSAVGKQVSVPLKTSDINRPGCVAVNQQTGDVIITPEDSRDWFVYIKEGAEWRQKVYSLGEEWEAWLRPVSWTPTGHVVMGLCKDRKHHIVKCNKEDGQQVWSSQTECDGIEGIADDSRGYIYCCDYACVHVYNTEGSLSHKVPRDPDTVHTLLGPRSICVDSRDRLLVLHQEKSEYKVPRVVTLWSSDGTYITKLLDNVGNVGLSGIRLHNDQTLVVSLGCKLKSYSLTSALQAV